MEDNLPYDSFLDVLVYEDGEPPREMAHQVYVHFSGDPEDTIIEGNSELLGELAPAFPSLPRNFPRPPTLAHFRRVYSGNVGYEEVYGIRFRVSLEPWATNDAERIRIYISRGRKLRKDLFTEDHWQIYANLRKKRDAERAKRGLPPIEQFLKAKYEQMKRSVPPES